MTVISPGVLTDVHFMLPVEIPFVGGLVPEAAFPILRKS